MEKKGRGRRNDNDALSSVDSSTLLQGPSHSRKRRRILSDMQVGGIFAKERSSSSAIPFDCFREVRVQSGNVGGDQASARRE